MEIVAVKLPASWASALINDDWSGLDEYSPESAAEARAWLESSELDVLTCSDETFISRWNGLLADCLEYHCTPRRTYVAAPQAAADEAFD